MRVGFPGTPGNDLTIEWLCERLNEFGVTPYGDSYLNGYQGRVNTYEKSEMIITYGSGETRNLVQGKDFLIPYTQGNFNNVVEKDSGLYAVVKSDGEYSNILSGSNDSSFVVFRNQAFKGLSAAYFPNMPHNPVISVQVSDEIAQVIENGAFESIEITNEVNSEVKELYNVVGVIKGTNPENCVVLSAHFDHSGTSGAIYFPGALDNASGTSALLYLAERLKAASMDEPFDFDIVFAFFNSEEAYFSTDDEATIGSRAFAPEIKGDYENIYNINIDVVGLEGEVSATKNSGSNELTEAFTEFAAKYGIICDNEASNPGDNLSFLDNGIPSFYFNNREVPEAVHTAMDTPDKISAGQIVKLSDMIVDFLKTPGHGVFKFDGQGLGYIQEKTAGLDPEQIEMASIYKAVFDTLINGGDASFYDGFYKYYPDEGQTKYSYSEYLQSHSEQSKIEDLRFLGGYELKIVSTVINNALITINQLVYINFANPSEYSIVIRPNIDTETYIPEYDVTEVSGLEGFSVLTHREGGFISGYLYNAGDNVFEIIPGNIFYETYIPVGGYASNGAIDESSFIELMGSLDFEKLLESWEK